MVAGKQLFFAGYVVGNENELVAAEDFATGLKGNDGGVVGAEHRLDVRIHLCSPGDRSRGDHNQGDPDEQQSMPTEQPIDASGDRTAPGKRAVRIATWSPTWRSPAPSR